MALIRKDNFGVFVTAGGWVCRPIGKTKFIQGMNVKTHHFGGSTRAGVGKTLKGKGDYDEYWTTTGMMLFRNKVVDGLSLLPVPEKQIKKLTDWYIERAKKWMW